MRKLKINGSSYTIAELAKELNITYATLSNRLYRNKVSPLKGRRSLLDLTFNYTRKNTKKSVMLFEDGTYLSRQVFLASGGTATAWNSALKLLKLCPDVPRNRVFEPKMTMLIVNGEYLTVREVAAKNNLQLTTLFCRLIAHPNTPTKDLLKGAPDNRGGLRKGEKPKRYMFNNTLKSPQEISKILGVTVNTVYRRLRHTDGVPADKVFSDNITTKLSGVCKIRLADIK